MIGLNGGMFKKGREPVASGGLVPMPTLSKQKDSQEKLGCRRLHTLPHRPCGKSFSKSENNSRAMNSAARPASSPKTRIAGR